MLLGHARGKVGSLVFNRLKGQQITKAHNASPANPKSYAQMAQRCRYNTAVARYKMAANKFFKFAFEDKRPHETDFNAFMRHNMMAQPYCANYMLDSGFVFGAPLSVASGSLPSLPYDGGAILHIYPDFPSRPLYGSLMINIAEALPRFSGIDEYDISVSDMSLLFLDSYPFLKDGDLLTFVIYSFDNNHTEEEGVYHFHFSEFLFNQFKLDLSDDITNLNQLKGLPFYCPGGELCLINFGACGNEYWGDPACYSGIIVTRKNASNRILASDCVLKPNDVADDFFSYYSVSEWNSAAIASYSPSSPAVLNPDK